MYVTHPVGASSYATVNALVAPAATANVRAAGVAYPATGEKETE